MDLTDEYEAAGGKRASLTQAITELPKREALKETPGLGKQVNDA